MNPTIAVDLGNSAAKWCRDGESVHRISLQSTDWTERLIEEVTRDLRPRDNLRWRLASVNRPSTKLLIGRLQEQRPDDLVQSLGGNEVPMAVKVSNPDRLGIDRLLAGWMASQLYPRQACIVIDAGSAITVDAVSEHPEFLGGAIIPGLRLQFESLARGTDALPALDWPMFCDSLKRSDLKLPGGDTVTAIRNGILIGIAASIDGLVRHSATHFEDRPFEVILTGGDAALLSGLLECSHQLRPRLVLDAINRLP